MRPVGFGVGRGEGIDCLPFFASLSEYKTVSFEISIVGLVVVRNDKARLIESAGPAPRPYGGSAMLGSRQAKYTAAQEALKIMVAAVGDEKNHCTK